MRGEVQAIVKARRYVDSGSLIVRSDLRRDDIDRIERDANELAHTVELVDQQVEEILEQLPDRFERPEKRLLQDGPEILVDPDHGILEADEEADCPINEGRNATKHVGQGRTAKTE